MDAIKNSSLRVGNFTGSRIGALMSLGKREMTPEELMSFKMQNPKSRKTTIEAGFGEPALNYIEEKNMERRLNRSLFDVSNAKPLTWGKCLEKRVFDILGLEYELCSTTTREHPLISEDKRYECWKGSPDAEKFDEGKTVVDIKCPLTIKSFCQLVDPLIKYGDGEMAIQVIRQKHQSGEEYFWQLVSNSIITGAKYAELIVYMPYLSELPEIRQYAKYPDDSDDKKYNWIAWGSDDDLPWLFDDGYYENVNVIRWEVSETDKEELTKRVLEASRFLNPFHK